MNDALLAKVRRYQAMTRAIGEGLPQVFQRHAERRP
jgi:hypothetical protein